MFRCSFYVFLILLLLYLISSCLDAFLEFKEFFFNISLLTTQFLHGCSCSFLVAFLTATVWQILNIKRTQCNDRKRESSRFGQKFAYRKIREITSCELTTNIRVTLGTLTSKGPISRLRLNMPLKAIAMIKKHQLYQHKVPQLLP